jgi:hypothetical protein
MDGNPKQDATWRKLNVELLGNAALRNATHQT